MTLFNELKEALEEMKVSMKNEVESRLSNLESKLASLEEENKKLKHQQYVIAKQMEFIIDELPEGGLSFKAWDLRCYGLSMHNYAEFYYKICHCGMPVSADYDAEGTVDCAMCLKRW